MRTLAYRQDMAFHIHWFMFTLKIETLTICFLSKEYFLKSLLYIGLQRPLRTKDSKDYVRLNGRLAMLHEIPGSQNQLFQIIRVISSEPKAWEWSSVLCNLHFIAG